MDDTKTKLKELSTLMLNVGESGLDVLNLSNFKQILITVDPQDLAKTICLATPGEDVREIYTKIMEMLAPGKVMLRRHKGEETRIQLGDSTPSSGNQITVSQEFVQTLGATLLQLFEWVQTYEIELTAQARTDLGVITDKLGKCSDLL